MITYYITYAILGVVVMLLGFLIAKKNNLTSNKPFLFYLIVSILILSLPALLGLLNYSFMPYGYIACGIIYLILGYLNQKVLKRILKKEPTFLVELSIFLFTGIFSAVSYHFIFNYTNELNYGMWASSSLLLYLFPCLYAKTNQLFHSIPLEIYKIWNYSKATNQDNEDTIDYSQLKVVKIELFKQETDLKPVTIDAKAPNDMLFGAWFKRLLTDYNKKSPLSIIDTYIGGEECGWIFYFKPTFLMPRRYIDFDKTFRENKIGERYTIIAKRVKENLNTK